jgi:hypothetical protein
VLLLCRAAAHAEPMAIGVPQFSPDLDYLHSDHPAAMLVRRAVGLPLVEEIAPAQPGAPSKLRLRAADEVSASTDRRSLSLRISRGARFADGRRVGAADALYSLEMCRKAGALAGATFTSREIDRGVQGIEEWIDISSAPSAEKPDPQLGTALGKCPILEKRSAVLFGPELGHGSMLVGCGLYHISHFQLGRQVVLQRSGEDRRPLKSLPEVVTIRGFSELEQGLTALRLGNIDALFSPNGEVVEKARKDETLVVSRCSGYDVVFRRGLRLDCLPEINFDGLGYDHI